MTVQTFDASGPFVVPSGVTVLSSVRLTGGGGGGGLASGGGGGGGGGEERLLTSLAVTPGETLDIDPGSGGFGRLITTGDGTAGGFTTLKRGATTLGLASGGEGGTTSGGGAGGTGGSGGVGTNGDPGSGGGDGGASGSGGAGGLAYGSAGDAPGGGGAGGDEDLTISGGDGAGGRVVIEYAAATQLDSVSYALAISPISFVHREITPLDSLTYSLAIGSINFRHQGRTSLESVSYGLSISDMVFGRRTPLDPLAYTLAIGDIGFSTSGGVVPLPPTNIVLPNRSPTARSLPATWASLRFRNFDSTPTRTQKLELLRERVVAGATRTFAMSFTDGLPTADPAEPLLRIIVMEALSFGTAAATAGVASTGSPAFRFFKDGVANGTVTFTGTTGVAAGIGDYEAGDVLEVYPPLVADATLDDVSISFLVTIG